MQSLVVLVWIYATAITIVLGIGWIENSLRDLEEIMKSVCMVCTLFVMWYFALPPTLQTADKYLSGGEAIECKKG